MGFFNKKIKCPHCNKNVDEEYAVNVGICPNCSKILNVKSSTNPLDYTYSNDSSLDISSYMGTGTSSQSSDSNSNVCIHSDGTSHKDNRFNSNDCLHSDGTSHPGNRYESNSPTHTNNTQGINSSPVNSSHTNNYAHTHSAEQTFAQRQNMNSALDTDYVRRVNEEANRSNNQRTHYLGHARAFAKKEKSVKKIFSILFVLFFLGNFVAPICVTMFSILSDNHGDDEYEYVYDSKYEYGTDEYYQDILESKLLINFLPYYFGKPLSEITAADFNSIKGINLLYDNKNESMSISMFSDEESYYSYTQNGFIDAEEFEKYCIGGNMDISLSEVSSCINDIFGDLSAFESLEYVYTNYTLPDYMDLTHLDSLTTFIAPNAIIDPKKFDDSVNLHNLYVYDIIDSSEQVTFNSALESLSVGSNTADPSVVEAIIDSTQSLKALSVNIPISQEQLGKLHELEYLDVPNIDMAKLIPYPKNLEVLKIDTAPSNLDNLRAFPSLSHLSISENASIKDYSVLKELFFLDSLELNNFSTQSLYDVISCTSSIRKLSVNNLEFSSQKPTLGYLANIPSLSDLKITNSNLNMDITNIFTTNNLTSITLDSCDFYASGYEFEENDIMFSIVITNCNYLKEYYDENLKLHKIDYSINDMCSYFDKFEELYYLDLRGSGVISAPTTNDQCYVEY